MNREKSCGAVVFTREEGRIKFVIIRSVNGFYGFPKGHMESGESEQETALREIREETGLEVSLKDGFRMSESYPLVREGRPDTIKEVVYFLAECRSPSPRAQDAEVADILLLEYNEALSLLRFESLKTILTRAYERLTL